MTTPNMAALKTELRDIVAKFDEDKNACLYDSDNYGDVYSAGLDSGELYLAKKILAEYFGE